MKVFMLAIAFVGTALARCPNDCNGKGICNAASVCECYANYMGNDCSQRLCNFGKAWIDTNLGDLNANGLIDTDQQVYSGFANTLVGEHYDPNYGIARGKNTDPWDEAHFYRECSNKGVCNRKTGICDCFPGFEGEGCRRMSCPLDCNGHGRCQLIEHEKLNTEYTLWDQDKVQRCKCDPGYTGPDCSVRDCPKGIDPVEFTYSNADSVYKLEFLALPSQPWNTGKLPNGPTYFTLTYTDDFGDEWTTHAITIYHQANCATDPNAKWDPATKSTSDCISTPFVAAPTITTKFGNVRASSFLDDFYKTNFLYGSSFVGEQVNNTLKHLPNDKVRSPYVWTVYNPVVLVSGKTPNADKAFLYPSESVPNFDAAMGIGPDGKTIPIIDNWWRCASEVNTKYCSKYGFSGPSLATDAPKYRFPIFTTALKMNGLGQKTGQAATQYLDCSTYSVCIFIRIQTPLGNKKLGLNYHYKPANYHLKATKSVPSGDEATIDDYDIIFGAEQRGTDKTSTAPKIVTLESVGNLREWIRELDGDPKIKYINGEEETLHACSRRGLCDYDTGRCECFFGYMGNSCHVRTPSENQGM